MRKLIMTILVLGILGGTGVAMDFMNQWRKLDYASGSLTVETYLQSLPDRFANPAQTTAGSGGTEPSEPGRMDAMKRALQRLTASFKEDKNGHLPGKGSTVTVNRNEDKRKNVIAEIWKGNAGNGSLEVQNASPRPYGSTPRSSSVPNADNAIPTTNDPFSKDLGQTDRARESKFY